MGCPGGGSPGRKYGEEVGVFIKLNPGAALEAEDVRDFCRGRISRYKIPKYVDFVTDYPLTASGKIQKLKNPAAPLEWDLRCAPTSCRESSTVRTFDLISIFAR